LLFSGVLVEAKSIPDGDTDNSRAASRSPQISTASTDRLQTPLASSSPNCQLTVRGWANCWRSPSTVSGTVSEGGGWTVLVMMVMLSVTTQSGGWWPMLLWLL